MRTMPRNTQLTRTRFDIVCAYHGGEYRREASDAEFAAALAAPNGDFVDARGERVKVTRGPCTLTAFGWF